MLYSVYIFFQRQGLGRVLYESGLSLEEAKKLCSGPESSSRTAEHVPEAACGVEGEWFMGFEKE